jgi:hypothetical protein
MTEEQDFKQEIKRLVELVGRVGKPPSPEEVVLLIDAGVSCFVAGLRLVKVVWAS